MRKSAIISKCIFILLLLSLFALPNEIKNESNLNYKPSEASSNSQIVSSIVTIICGALTSVFIIRNVYFPKHYKSSTSAPNNVPPNKDPINRFKSNINISLEDIEACSDEYLDLSPKNSEKSLPDITGEFPFGYNKSFNSAPYNPGIGVNFLDAFLKSIQIFGYLEDAVFYELSRQLQTQRVLAGEKLYSIEKRRDFCVVVDGHITVYAVDTNYPLSSKLKHSSNSTGFSFENQSDSSQSYDSIQSSDYYSQSDNDDMFPKRSINSKQILREVGQGKILSGILQILKIFTENILDSHEIPSLNETNKTNHIIGIATVDTTLAVIPEKAFRRVREKFPKSAAHMIQVILTRLQRVTLFTMQNYLNLSNQVVSFEKKLSSIPSNPDYLNFPLGNLGLGSSKSPSPSSSKDTVDNILTLCMLEYESRNTNIKSSFQQPFNSNNPSTSNGLGIRSIPASRNASSFKNSNYFSSINSTVNIPSNGLEISSSLIDDDSIILINESSLEFLLHIHGPNLLRKKFSDNKYSETSINCLSSEEPNFLFQSKIDPSLFRESSSDSEELWKVPRPSDISNLFATAVNLVSKSLGIASVDSFNRPSSMSLITHPSTSKSYQKVDDLNSQISSSEDSISSHKAFSSQPISIFPKIDNQEELDTTLNRKKSAPTSKKSKKKPLALKRYFSPQNTSTFSFNDIKLIYAPPGKTIIKKGQRPDGIFCVISGFLEFTNYKISENNSEFENSSSEFSVPDSSTDNSLNQEIDIPKQSKEMSDIAYNVQMAFSQISDKEILNSEKDTAIKIKSIIDFNNKSSVKLDKEKNSTSRKGSFIYNDRKNHSYNPGKRNRDGNRSNSTKKSFRIGAGGMVGYFSAITDMPSNVTVRVCPESHGHARTNSGTILAYLPLTSIKKLVSDFPIVYLTLAKHVSNNLSFLVHHIDYALDWIRIPGGKVVYNAGASSDAVHIVLSGRLRAISQSADFKKQKPILSEYGQGESIGETDVLAGDKRTFSLHTIRDSELVWIPKTLFAILISTYPKLTFHISKLIATRILMHSRKSQPMSEYGMSSKSLHSISNDQTSNQTINNLLNEPLDAWNSNSNLKTVCILPVSENVPIKEFASRLYDALVETSGPSIALLDNSSIMNAIGDIAFSRVGKLKTQSFLAEIEEKRKMVLYVADSSVNSPWTLRCIRQADCILIVGLGDEDSSVGPFEQLVLATRSTARKELVLLHNDRYCIPGTTRNWLSTREWIHAHHHIQMPLNTSKNNGNHHLSRNKSVFGISSNTQIVRNDNIFGLFRYLYFKLFGMFPQNLEDDFKNNIIEPNNSRRSRKYSTGSVNGNFSAEELPGNEESEFSAMLDSSIAATDTFKNIKGRFKSYYKKFISKRRGSISAPFKGCRSDFNRLSRRLTNKSVGLVLSGGGARGNALLGVLRAFEEAGIPVDMIGGTSIGAFYSGLYAQEPDTVSIFLRSKLFSNNMKSMWRKLLDVTWPILSYTTGNEFNRALWKVFKSTEIEDLWLPYYCVSTNVTHSRLEVHTSGTLWKYCRASMSLSGFLPPLCDSDGQMLVDGGYLDNLPVDYMRYGLGANMIFAIDIAGEDDTNPVHYGESVSGIGVILNNLNPFKKYSIPSLSDIQSRLAYVSSVQTLKSSKSLPGVVYAKIPPGNCGVLEFSKFNEVYKKGYLYASSWVNAWRSAGKLDIWAKKRIKSKLNNHQNIFRTHSYEEGADLYSNSSENIRRASRKSTDFLANDATNSGSLYKSSNNRSASSAKSEKSNTDVYVLDRNNSKVYLEYQSDGNYREPTESRLDSSMHLSRSQNNLKSDSQPM
ncbi:Lysophospholipase NTE1 [Smittium culicis]|uniref:Lysophospholipase NTE1 n=1 Tax=Smittium culicis TaxID=133412 RepID=A0A1R1XZ62_9FUNG|nr:Lysophospholipase NTE1 [Smittium culicis]